MNVYLIYFEILEIALFDITNDRSLNANKNDFILTQRHICREEEVSLEIIISVTMIKTIVLVSSSSDVCTPFPEQI